MKQPPTVEPPSRRPRLHRLLWWLGTAILAYLLLAYLLAPALWDVHAHRHPALDTAPRHSRTSSGIQGDPLNVAVVGPESQLARAMLAAGWHPADPLTLGSCLRIAEDTVIRRPYADAPVSNLFLWNRKQDLAFEQPVGGDPRRRHHVRFWKADTVDAQGRPLWIGGATFDESVGVSHTTGQITHHIAADVDAERDKLVADLQATGQVSEAYSVPDFQTERTGKNGGGDPYQTDGALGVAVLGK